MLASFIHTPGDSLTQRPDPPPFAQMSPGQSDFIALVRELKIDVQLVHFIKAVPVLSPHVDGQTFQSLELGLRGAPELQAPG